MSSTRNRRLGRPERLAALMVTLCAAAATAGARPPASLPGTPHAATLPSLDEVIAARTDLWGEAALRQPDGPSYEFFKDLLPPLRYVNAAFRHYPIVLSAPQNPVKARLVSNGSAINPRPHKSTWHDIGLPVTFSVGDPPEPFGRDLARLSGPTYLQGYLPIVQLTYRRGPTTCALEAFAAVEPEFAGQGAVLVRFTAGGTGSCRISAQLESPGPTTLADVTIRDQDGRGLVAFDPAWRWQSPQQTLSADLPPGQSAVLIIFTDPAPPTVPALTGETFDRHRDTCIRRWNDLLARGIDLHVPEPIIMSAWRSLVIGTFMIAIDDQMNYGFGTSYQRLCEGESGDAVRALMLFGHPNQARRMVGPLLDFDRYITRFHIAGLKLDLLGHYYWITRDADYVHEKEPIWRKVVDFIAASRDPACGLVGKDRYAADIDEPVFSFKSNANCWRGLHNLSAVLRDMGHDQADRVAGLAADLRKSIIEACRQSERHDVDPPFIPMALLAGEQPYDQLTALRKGSYYNIISSYVLGSGIFEPGSPQEQWLLDYQRRHGGIAMGMLRSLNRQGGTEPRPGLNPMYGIRRQLTLLRRDESDQALVGFYGHLAQGMTRDTYIGGEGSRLIPLDEHGRELYLPPNCTSNALFLLTLRHLLAQDWDMDNDGRPETLRLLYAAPRRWLGDGGRLHLRKAPTAFGELSLEVDCRLDQGRATVRIAAPPRPIQRFSLRLPLPAGWKAVSAHLDDQSLPLEPDATVDLTGRQGSFSVQYRVTRADPAAR